MCMQAFRKIMTARELSPVMDIPDGMQNDALTPRVKSLLGSFKMPEKCSSDYKNEIAEALEAKYL